MPNSLGSLRYVCSVLAIVTCGFVLTAPAQQPTAQPRSIKQVFEEDQADRANLDYSKITKETWQKVLDRDSARREETRQLLASGAAKTGEDFRDASFIFQHGHKPEDFLLAHVLAMAAITKGDATARFISAATLDRYLQSLKQPQVFGTQYLLKDPNAVYKDPKALRDITQDPYDNAAVSDSLRKVFCVEAYAAQQQDIAAMKEGKNPQPPSCQ